MLFHSTLFIYSPVVHIGEYPHGLYAIPSLVDELSSTVAAGILLLEGPGTTDTTKTTTSPSAKSLVNVNLRLPHDKSDWMVPYHSIASKPPNSPQPPILFFGTNIFTFKLFSI